MANSEQFKALLKSHINGDEKHFFSIAMQIAAREAKLGHGKLAAEIRELIESAKIGQSTENFAKNPIPINQPRGELAHLLEAFYPKAKLQDLILGKFAEYRLKRIIKEQRNLIKIREHGLYPRRKLLLTGPSGTGKTLTASVLAGTLGIPLFLVRLDSLITKYMGETALKLRQIFDAVEKTRGVYFFDEFDAIGSQRGFMNDVGEIRRILNSFLQMLEQDKSNSIVLAATNHPEILDYALFRRFDDIIEYELPEHEQIIIMFKNRLMNFKNDNWDWNKFANCADGLSNADIVRISEEVIKYAIINNLDTITEADIIKSIDERKKIHRHKQ